MAIFCVPIAGGCVLPWPAFGRLGERLTYVFRNFPNEAAHPGASLITFTLGILALLGPRVPASLRVFVAALAVVDDALSVPGG